MSFRVYCSRWPPETSAPHAAHQTAKVFVQGGRQRNLLACPVERDRLPDVVNDDLARIAIGQVLLEAWQRADFCSPSTYSFRAAKSSSHFMVRTCQSGTPV